MRFTTGAAVVLAGALCVGATAGGAPAKSAPAGSATAGGEADRRKLAEDLLDLTRADKSVDEVRDQMQALMGAQLGTLDVPDGLQEKASHYQQQVVNLIFSEMNPARLRTEYVDAYATTFTAEEMTALIAFFKSGPGKAYTEKMPTITKKM